MTLKDQGYSSSSDEEEESSGGESSSSEEEGDSESEADGSDEEYTGRETAGGAESSSSEDEEEEELMGGGGYGSGVEMVRVEKVTRDHELYTSPASCFFQPAECVNTISVTFLPSIRILSRCLS